MDPAAASAAAAESIRAAEDELATMFGGGAATPRPTRHDTPRTDTRATGSGSGVPDPAGTPIASLQGSRRTPVEGGRWSKQTRRRVGGIVITLAFIPIGLIGSAALAGDDGKSGPAKALKAVVSPGGEKGSDVSFDPAAVRARLSKNVSVVARVPAGKVKVRAQPRTKAKTKLLRALELKGKRLPLVLLVKQRRTRWLQVYLPSRPNLSMGWVPRKAVKLRANPYRVKIELTAHRITAWRGNKVMVRGRIGVGKALTPTPTGQYYVTDLLRPPDPGGTYGPYAFGLSGHSPVLTSFAGGDGQLGLHGTNRPEALGSDVSHGCIRVKNRMIRKLARTLPLGTPLAIRR